MRTSIAILNVRLLYLNSQSGKVVCPAVANVCWGAIESLYFGTDYASSHIQHIVTSSLMILEEDSSFTAVLSVRHNTK